MSDEVVTTQNFESDMWDDMAGNVPEDSPGGDYAELPDKAWVLAKTATKENGKAAPEIRNQEIKRGERAGETFIKFNVGLITVGGEQGKVLPDQHRNKTTFFEAFLLPGPKEDQNKPVSGRFSAFLNSMFSSGIGAELDNKEQQAERTAARWQHTVGALRAAQQRYPQCNLEAYTGTPAERKAKLLAGLAVCLLEEESQTILFKTRSRSYTPRGGEEKRISIEAGTFEDDTPSNREKRKIVAFPSDMAF